MGDELKKQLDALGEENLQLHHQLLDAHRMLIGSVSTFAGLLYEVSGLHPSYFLADIFNDLQDGEGDITNKLPQDWPEEIQKRVEDYNEGITQMNGSQQVASMKDVVLYLEGVARPRKRLN